MQYLSYDPHIKALHEYIINGEKVSALLKQNINSILEIPTQYTMEYYKSQQNNSKKSIALACWVREIFMINNLRDFLEKNQPQKDIIVILGDAHIQNIEQYHKDFLEMPMLGNINYSFIFCPLGHSEIDQEHIQVTRNFG